MSECWDCKCAPSVLGQSWIPAICMCLPPFDTSIGLVNSLEGLQFLCFLMKNLHRTKLSTLPLLFLSLFILCVFVPGFMQKPAEFQKSVLDPLELEL